VFETLGRMEEHLAKNGLKLDATKYRLGRKLVVDPSSERVVGDDQANQILEGTYRKGYELPADLA